MSYALLAEADSFRSEAYDPILIAGTVPPALTFLATACVLVVAVVLRSDAIYRLGMAVHAACCTVWAVGFLLAIFQGKASGPTGPIGWALIAFHGYLWSAAPARLEGPGEKP